MDEQLYAITDSVPDRKCSIITNGKPYRLESGYGFGESSFTAKLDDNVLHHMMKERCPHLDGGSWTIVTEPELTPEQRRMAGLPTEDATIAELRERIEALEARVPVEEETEWPHYADDYWYIDSALIACKAKWFGVQPDSYRRDGMGIYKTQEEAEKRANQIRKTVQTLNAGGTVYLDDTEYEEVLYS